MPDRIESNVNNNGFQPAAKRTMSPPFKSLHRMQRFYQRRLEDILGIRALAGRSAQAASYRGEQALTGTLAQLVERLPIPGLGLFDELSFLSFVMHGRVHLNHISLKPPKALAETKKRTARFLGRDGS